MKTTLSQIEGSYKIAKSIYDKQVSKKDGIKQLATFNINGGSAQIILNQVFPQMMEGKRFTRTLSAPFFEYFLSNILKDYGSAKFSLVLSALKKHIEYNNSIGNPKLKLKTIYNKYIILSKSSIDIFNENEKEQEEIEVYLKRTMTRNQVIEELNNLSPIEPAIVIVNNKKYKRDNKTIALLKFIREFKCQICETSILKSDGQKYVEAAHIIHKHKTGPETPDNIIILCPNHHKEFDLGNLEIKRHTEDQIDFLLNGVNYSIVLKIV